MARTSPSSGGRGETDLTKARWNERDGRTDHPLVHWRASFLGSPMDDGASVHLSFRWRAVLRCARPLHAHSRGMWIMLNFCIIWRVTLRPHSRCRPVFKDKKIVPLKPDSCIMRWHFFHLFLEAYELFVGMVLWVMVLSVHAHDVITLVGCILSGVMYILC